MFTQDFDSINRSFQEAKENIHVRTKKKNAATVKSLFCYVTFITLDL